MVRDGPKLGGVGNKGMFRGFLYWGGGQIGESRAVGDLDRGAWRQGVLGLGVGMDGMYGGGGCGGA